jgi:hypothetical protein
MVGHSRGAKLLVNAVSELDKLNIKASTLTPPSPPPLIPPNRAFALKTHRLWCVRV